MRGRVVAPGLFCEIGLLTVRINDCGRESALALRVRDCNRELVFAGSPFSDFDISDLGSDLDRVASTTEEGLSSESLERDFGGLASVEDLAEVGG